MAVPPPLVFDAALVRRRLARAARGTPADFLLTRTIDDIAERLGAVRRRFARIVDLATPQPSLARSLEHQFPDATVVRLAAFAAPGSERGPAAQIDLERPPLAAESVDLVVSALALQTVNDLPGLLAQVRRALRPDGLLLAALLGGRTLQELRTVLTEAEAELTGGVSPRVAPFPDIRDMGGLLQRAGFGLPVADSEVVTVRYDTLFALMADLRAMGATNPLAARSRRPTSRSLFARAAALYARRFADQDGRIRASFEIVSISGWAPHASQQPPAGRGSGKVSLAAVLGDQSRNLVPD